MTLLPRTFIPTRPLPTYPSTSPSKFWMTMSASILDIHPQTLSPPEIHPTRVPTNIPSSPQPLFRSVMVIFTMVFLTSTIRSVGKYRTKTWPQSCHTICLGLFLLCKLGLYLYAYFFFCICALIYVCITKHGTVWNQIWGSSYFVVKIRWPSVQVSFW